MRSGIHDVKEIHRKQLETEQKYLDVNTSLEGHRRLSRTSGTGSVSPNSPLSPSPNFTPLSASAFNLKQHPQTPAKSSDNLILESFFGSDNMSKLNVVLGQSRDSLQRGKSQSTDELLSADLPPLPEKKRSQKGNSISRSPKTSWVNASSPDVSSLRRNNEPISDVGLEMKKLRMRLCETANQTVAEIEERFSPKINRLTLGPAINLSPENSHLTTDHSHQGSLDSYPSPIPSVRHGGTPPSGHGRQRSLPLSVIGQTQPLHSLGKQPVYSPPKSPSPTSNPYLTNPVSRSPTPPHQQGYHHHSRQTSLGSANVSGLITSSYQGYQQQRPMAQPQPYEVVGNRSHGRPPAPPLSRQYSPRAQSTLNISGGALVQPSGTRPNSRNHAYASNPNLLNDSSTHYSTAVIKKRKTSGSSSKSGTSDSPSHSTSPVQHEYDRLQQVDKRQVSSHQPPMAHGSNHVLHMDRKFSPRTQYTTDASSHHQPNSYSHQRSIPHDVTAPPTQPGKMRTHTSAGELRASMRKIQYVPFADQKRSLAVGRGYGGLNDQENTWL